MLTMKKTLASNVMKSAMNHNQEESSLSENITH